MDAAPRCPRLGDIFWRLYLDEVGTDDLTNLYLDNHRYLSLTGVIIHLEHVESALNLFMRALKHTVFDFDPDDIIHLHRSDIVKRKSVFGQLNDSSKRDLFDKLVCDMISTTDYRAITVVIDKLEMTRQAHWAQTHPYHYLMQILVEKYVQFLERKKDIGDIMPEARQGKKDRKLQAVFDEIRANGTRYLTAERIESCIRASNLKFRTKKENISGLQLCDLIAHPSHMFIRSTKGHNVNLGDFAKQVIQILTEQKYDRSYRGTIEGYGTKFCP